MGVTAEKVGNTVELTVTANGKPAEDIPGGATFTVPMEETKPGAVAVLVHADGTREDVRKSVVDGDSVTIPLGGSTKLEIVDNGKQFTDVGSGEWYAQGEAWAASKGIVTG